MDWCPMSDLNASQTIFSLFYAILYGAIFTISDRWRPFTMAGLSCAGWRRVFLSFGLLVVVPIAYFIVSLFSLSQVKEMGPWKLLEIILLVSPLYASYVLWALCVSCRKKPFFSVRERRLLPVKESLHWTSNRSHNRLFALLLMVIILAGTLFHLCRLWKPLTG